MSDAFIEHWSIAVFSTWYGVWLVAFRACFASSPVPSCAFDDDDERRVDAVVATRRALDRAPRIAYALISASVAFVGAALALWTSVPPATLFAAETFVVGALQTAAFVRSRRSTRRVASLERPRHAFGAPLALAACASAGPLLWVSDAPAAATIAALATAALASCAAMVAAMPTHLVGDDLAAERYVDDRLRRTRTWRLLSIAVAPAWVFEAFELPAALASPAFEPVRVAVAYASLALLLGFVWRAIALGRGDRAADVAMALHADA